jgi:uncharacterized delta-60 repeat protein
VLKLCAPGAGVGDKKESNNQVTFCHFSEELMQTSFFSCTHHQSPRRTSLAFFINLLQGLALVALFAIAAQPALAAFANGTGIAIIPNPPSVTVSLGAAIAVDSSGKIVAVGSCNNNTYCVVRLNTDGTLDTTFNASGATPGQVIIPGLVVRYASGRVRIAFDSNNKIVVAGTCYVAGSFGDRNRFCIARLNANGTLDDTFDGPDTTNPGNGRFIVPITTASDDTLHGLTIEQINGQKPILVGNCGWPTGQFHCIARLNNDGSFDATFSGPGASVAASVNPDGPGRDVFLHLYDDGSGVARAVTTQPNGKILIAGTCIYWANQAEIHVCLTKLNENGTLDTDFNETLTPPFLNPGRVRVVYRNENNAVVNQGGYDIALQPDGDFLVLCKHSTSDDHCVYRFNSGGTLDTNFSSGEPRPAFPGATIYGRMGTPIAMAMSPSTSPYGNRVLTLGNCSSGNEVGFCVGAVRNQSGGEFDGTVDDSLTGPNGDKKGEFRYAAWPFSAAITRVGPYGLAINNSGEFFVVSACSGQMCIYKFRGDGALDTSPCVADVNGDGNRNAPSDGLGLIRAMLNIPGAPALPAGLGYDIDGDGLVNARVDGLLFARRMLGFRDASLLSGIALGSNARRTSAADIQSYLSNRCGI